jgi:hypothetical protein
VLAPSARVIELVVDQRGLGAVAWTIRSKRKPIVSRTPSLRGRRRSAFRLSPEVPCPRYGDNLPRGRWTQVSLYPPALSIHRRGRILIVVGIAADVWKVYHARDKVKAVVESAGGWAGATAGPPRLPHGSHPVTPPGPGPGLPMVWAP